MEIVKMPTLSISPGGITIYNTWIGPRKYSGAEMLNERDKFENRKRPASNQHDGEMSDKALKRMENAMKWLLFMSKNKIIYDRSTGRNIKYRICFVTLTLASKQVHSDQEIKNKLLNQVIVELKQSYNMRHFLWRAEKQLNGNIHFHLLTNVFIPQDSLRKKWNRIQNKLGYVDRYRDMMVNKIKCFEDYYNKFIDQGTYTQLMQRYIKAKATGFRNPNSTDIHSVKKVKNVVAYLYKYFSKRAKENKAKIENQADINHVSGKLWGLSHSLSSLKTITVGIGSEVSKELNTIMTTYYNRVFRGDYFTFIRMNFKDLIKMKCDQIMGYVYDKMKEFNSSYLVLN